MTRFGTELIESLTDALAHAQGRKTGVRVHTVEMPDVRDRSKASNAAAKIRDHPPDSAPDPS